MMYSAARLPRSLLTMLGVWGVCVFAGAGDDVYRRGNSQEEQDYRHLIEKHDKDLPYVCVVGSGTRISFLLQRYIERTIHTAAPC